MRRDIFFKQRNAVHAKNLRAPHSVAGYEKIKFKNAEKERVEKQQFSDKNKQWHKL